MKRLTKELYVEFLIGVVSGIVFGGATYWYSQSWELATVVGIVLFAGALRSMNSTYSAFRRKPEYQKDTKDNS